MHTAVTPFTNPWQVIRQLAGILLVAWLCTVPASAGQTYPYQAIIKNSTTVRCGPGESYYACLELTAGSKVEVHALTENGFLAIRPPRGSSSWVDAADLVATDRSLGRVTRSGTVSWIGSQLRDPRDHNWQVQLQQGDPLRLLEKRAMQIHSDLPPATYYQVAPPAGEFRWIPAADVATSPVAVSPPASTRWVDSTIQPASALMPVRQASTTAPLSAEGWRSRHTQRAPRVAALESETRLAGLWPGEPGEQPPAQASQRIMLLDTRLSQLMAGESEPWEFEALRTSLRQLLQQGLGQPFRQRVDILLKRIDQYQQVQQGKLLDPDSTRSLDTSIYDVAGWLMKVHASDQPAPPYAILDDNGRVLEFVSPAPGLNLHRYLKKRVGIFGYQSYLASLKTPHITVYRIVDLARHEPR
jgi:hypothetical protein